MGEGRVGLHEIGFDLARSSNTHGYPGSCALPGDSRFRSLSPRGVLRPDGKRDRCVGGVEGLDHGLQQTEQRRKRTERELQRHEQPPQRPSRGPERTLEGLLRMYGGLFRYQWRPGR
jgi:hypothetical protein